MFFNLFGVWVIAFHTPKNMREYGIALTAYQIVVLLSDALISWVFAPYFIFPIPGGYPNGWLWKWGVSTQGMGIGITFHMNTLMLIMFMLRHQAIMPAGHLLKFERRHALAFYIGLQLYTYVHVASMSVYVFTGHDVEATKTDYSNRYPIFRQFLEIPRCFVIPTEDRLFMIIYVCSWPLLTFLAMMAASTSSFHVLRTRRHIMSGQTYRLQQQWMKNCVLQVSIPFWTVVLPVVIAVLDVTLDLVMLFGVIPMLTFFLGWHGFASTVVTLLVYRPYRTYIRKMMRRLGAGLLPFVGIVLNFYGLWVIGFHTPKSMRDFGIALTAYQVLVLLTDALLSSILSPYFIFPIPGGYPTGPCSAFTSSSQLCVYLNVIVISIYIFYGDDQEATKALYLDSYPILRQFLEIPRCYTFTPDNGLIVVYGVAGWTVLTFIVILAASVSSFHVLHVKQHTMSVQTHRLQKQWMKNCLLQVSVPFAFVVAPVIALILIVVFELTVYFGEPVTAT
ncbi:unnamed protein product, partial [Mesorhabditis spiculigera]